MLPAGTHIVLSSLIAENSLGAVHVGATGAFTLTAFTGSPQLTTIVNAAGDPILMGWLGAGQTTINAASTGDALVFLAGNCFALGSDVRLKAIALIPAIPGLSKLQVAIAEALVANPDPFARGNTPVTSALAVIFASLEAKAAAPTSAVPSPLDIVINPVDGTSGSGVRVLNDFPDGVHFTNTYRRRALAFVDRKSYVSASGTLVASPAALLATPEPIPPVTGTSGGAISTFYNIFNADYAFSEISTPTIALPLVPNSQKTTYVLTIVGPGHNPGVLALLSPAEREAQGNAGATFFIEDLLIPLFSNVALPALSDAITASLAAPGGSVAVADLERQILSNPRIDAEQASGQYGAALTQSVNLLLTDPKLADEFQHEILDRVATKTGRSATIDASKAFAKWNVISQGVSYGLAAFDTTVVGSQYASANEADQWQVDVIPDSVAIAPVVSKVAHARSETLAANVLAAGKAETAFLEYRWINTARAGHIVDPISGDSDNFVTSSKTVTYTADDVATAIDTVRVAVATKARPGVPSVPIGKVQSASITVVPNAEPLVKIAPSACIQFPDAGGKQTYTATAVDAPKGLTLNYGWWLELPTKRQHLSVPGGVYMPYERQLIGPSDTAVVSVDPAPMPVSGGFNDEVDVFLYYVENGQLRSFGNSVIFAGARFANGLVTCNTK